MRTRSTAGRASGSPRTTTNRGGYATENRHDVAASQARRSGGARSGAARVRCALGREAEQAPADDGCGTEAEAMTVKVARCACCKGEDPWGRVPSEAPKRCGYCAKNCETDCHIDGPVEREA